MRIIAGTARNRRIDAPEGKNTRPTLDRVRENLFNILQTRVSSSAVLDLFAGSGALSLEALSRGASFAVMCDIDRNANRVEKRNTETLGFSERAELYCCDWRTAVRKLTERNMKFDLVFLDPPYRMNDLREVFDGLAPLLDDTVTNPIEYITPFDVESETELTSNFVGAYTAKYGAAPDQFAADGYDCIYTIKACLEKAGMDDASIDFAALTDIMVSTITAEDFSYDGVTGSMTWDASGACTKIPVIVVLN